jgi:hypothetical protein
MFSLAVPAFSGEAPEKSPLSGKIPVKFVYIHGTNQNTLESRFRFEQSVKRLHGEIVNVFENNRLIQTQWFHQNQYYISTEPVVFFWGDRSQSELEFLKRDLTLLTGIKTRLAGRVREEMAYMLHDAVWFERPKNKYQILKALHETVMLAHGENQPIVLLGHSAGSLVAFNYLTYLLPFLDQETLLRVTKSPSDVVSAIRRSDLPPTCALALIDSGAFRPDLSGRLMSTYQEPELGIASLSAESRQIYLDKLPEAIRTATQTSCLPPNALQGMITFGSPIPLFESDVGRYEDVFSLLVSYMLKYLLENDMVWLHVNHIKDPVGFPLPDYQIMAKRIQANQGIDIQQKGGIIASNSNIRQWTFIQNAHTWYWKKPELFAKELVKTYEAGYTEHAGKAEQPLRK